MSINLPTHAVKQFANTVALLTQQTDSRFQAFVESGFHQGEQASPVDQFGAIEASENTTRFASMPRVDADAKRRWVSPRDFDLPQLVDQNDLLRMINDPKAALAQAAVAGHMRKRDLVIIQAMSGTNYVGKDGTTTQTLGSGQAVGVNTGGTASKLNVAKLRAAKKLLMAANIDVRKEQIFVGVNADNHDALLGEIQVTSTDYNEARDGKPVMTEGLIERFMGFNFVLSELYETGTDDQSGTSTSLPFWCKSGVYLGKWKDIGSSISIRNDLRGEPYQIYTTQTCGATRLEEVKVGRIWCR